MQTLLTLFGQENHVNILQMSVRALVVFLIALVLLRIAGRRSFGLHAPFDNIILVLLGAILSRAVVGASPFFPTLTASFVICVVHRLLALAGLYSSAVGKIIKGGKIPLYQKGKTIKKNMKRGLISEEDLRTAVRLRTNSDSLDQVESIYMERNGHISTIKKS